MVTSQDGRAASEGFEALTRDLDDLYANSWNAADRGAYRENHELQLSWPETYMSGDASYHRLLP